MKFNYTAHDSQSKSMKNSDQVSCPGSSGKEKWMKLTGPVTIIPIFSSGFDSLLLEKKFIMRSG